MNATRLLLILTAEVLTVGIAPFAAGFLGVLDAPTAMACPTGWNC